MIRSANIVKRIFLFLFVFSLLSVLWLLTDEPGSLPENGGKKPGFSILSKSSGIVYAQRRRYTRETPKPSPSPSPEVKTGELPRMNCGLIGGIGALLGILLIINHFYRAAKERERFSAYQVKNVKDDENLEREIQRKKEEETLAAAMGVQAPSYPGIVSQSIEQEPIDKEQGVKGASDESSADTVSQPVPEPQPLPVKKLPAKPVVDEAKLQKQIEAFVKRNPGFTYPEFKAKVKDTFLKALKAWNDGNLEPAKSLMTEVEFCRWQAHARELLNKGQANILEDIEVSRITVVEVDDNYDGTDYIRVAIEGSMIDKTIDLAGTMVSGSDEPELFVEYWAFIRKQETGAGFYEEQLLADRCGNCQAAFEDNYATECPYCSTPREEIKLPEDWTLGSTSEENKKMTL